MATTAQRHARASFQETLDDLFPQGALCVEMAAERGHPRPTGVEVVTGRIVCTESRRRSAAWMHRVVLDPRKTSDEEGVIHTRWVTGLEQLDEQHDLWEAIIVDVPGTHMLRINASPRPPWRPTRAMRAAVTQVYAAVLEPSESDGRERRASA